MSSVRKIIANAMETLGYNYAYLEWLDDPVDLYFTGEYQEGEALDESGYTEIAFILTGFSRVGVEALEEAKETIKQHFDNVSGLVIADNGSAVAIFYGGSFIVRTMDAELNKIQINLNIKEWKVK